MRILLINPPAISFYHRLGLRMPPLGLAYIAAVLNQHGHEVKIIDLNVEKIDYNTYPYREFDLVGISSDTARYPVALKIAQAAKEQGAKVVMGGYHVTFLDEDALNTGLVDYVVRGEGECVLNELVTCLENRGDIKTVQGISFKIDNKIYKNPNAPLIENLDSIPFPARDLLPLNKYVHKLFGRVSASIVTSRGCPYDCAFCSVSKFSGIKWRGRSVENIMEEIELLYKKYNYRAFTFVDDNFTFNPDRVAHLCEKIIKKGYDIIWWAQTRVDTILKNIKLVKLMAQAGAKMFFIGFESANQQVLEKYGKGGLAEKAFQAVELLKKHGIKVTGSFILGALEETKEMIKQTIKFAKKLDLHLAQFSLLTPYPGTRLYQIIKAQNRLLTDNWEYFWGGRPTIKHDFLSPKQLQRLIIKAYASFYLRPKKFFTQGIPYLYELLIGYKKP